MPVIDLVALVGNARYDVMRYPAHVVMVTDKGHRDNITALIHRHAFSTCEVAVRYAVAVLMTFVIPFGVLYFKLPEECAIIDVIRGLTHFDMDAQMQEQYETCRADLVQSLHASMLAVLAGPTYNIAITCVMRLSMVCTTRVYSFYVNLVLQAFQIVAPSMKPVLFFNTTKPESCDVHNFTGIWKRLAFLPYTLMLWLFGIMIVVMLDYSLTDLSFGFVLALLLWQIYLPTLVEVFKGPAIVRELTQAELQRRSLEVDSVGTGRRHDRGMPTDVWWRLFNSDEAVFTCSSAELDLIVQYFEASHEGVNGQRWPIWWHDELCITENNGLEAVYLDDVNYLMIASPDRVSSRMSAEYSDLRANFTAKNLEALEVAQKHLEQLTERVEKLWDDKGQR